MDAPNHAHCPINWTVGKSIFLWTTKRRQRLKTLLTLHLNYFKVETNIEDCIFIQISSQQQLYFQSKKLSRGYEWVKKISKNYKSSDKALGFCWYQHFLPEISKFCYILKYRYRLHFRI